jgi:DtxR family Mn-dependent transcriptional regulator
MYLITVARAGEAGAEGPVPITALAADLGVSAVSANEKVHKLAGRGLLAYSPYKGVELTRAGEGVAHRVLRTRRVWAAFLTRLLGYGSQEADALACRLEHATPPEAAERLAAFIGEPGAPEAGPAPAPVPLSEVPVGRPVEIVSADEGFGEFLAAEALVPGTVLTVLAVGPSGLLVESGGRRVHLGTALAGALEVREGPSRAAG